MRSIRGFAALFFLAFLAWPASVGAETDVHRVLDEARKHLKAGRYQEAVELCSKLLDGAAGLDAGSAGIVRLIRADAYLRKDEARKSWDDVNAVLRSGAADGPTIASAYWLRGVLHLKRNRRNEALEDFTESIKTRHENTEVRALSFAHRGMAYLQGGELDKAISDLNKAIELDPGSSFAYAVRGLAHRRQGKAEYSRQDARQAASMNPDEATLRVIAMIDREPAASIPAPNLAMVPPDGVSEDIETSLDSSGPHSVTVPVRDGGRILVQVRFSKSGKLRSFVLDTGAQVTLVDKATLEAIRNETEVVKLGQGLGQIADGSRHRMSYYQVKSAYINSLPLGSIIIHAFEKDPERPVNLLGMQSLSNVTVSIDTARKKVVIGRKGGL